MKVLFFTNIPVPYRMDFFNELGKYCDLTVLMENDSAGNSLNRDWLKSYNVENYLLYILPKIGKASKTRINYGYHKFIKKGKYDIIAKNECNKICLYRDLKESEVKNIMGRITFQIECQVFKDED